MASQTKKAPPKGILKKPSGGAAAAAASSSAPKRKPDPRDVAIQHAKIIHERRLLEDAITDSIIMLAKLPNTLPGASPDDDDDGGTSFPSPPHPSSSSSSDNPTPESLFKSHVRLFQPSDYDALIEERGALGSCGYALCGRPRRRLAPGTGAYKILGWGRADFAIVPRAEAERWCSRACARRAMYVKVQLSETAAWERAGIDTIAIELLEEAEAEQQRKRDEGKSGGGGADADAERDKVAKELDKEDADRRQKAARDARDLALERGDTADGKKAAKRSVSVTIREKKVMTTAVQEPSLALGGGGGEGHLVLDGYKTKFDPQSQTISRGTTIKDSPDNSNNKEGKASE